MALRVMRILFDRQGAERSVKSEALWLEASIRAANPLASTFALRKCRAGAFEGGHDPVASNSISDLANQ